jgi:tRNA (Thr-GGU) A37 N-methylase
VLRVRGLDALDGTPVLDIKPYLPPYDAVADARLPPWAVEGP